MTTILFPGQGVQKKGMGQELFANYKELTDECSKILGYSIEELCVHNPENRLSQTQYVQPLLFFVNMLSYYDKQSNYGTPTFLLGHSLGEYNALCVAGAFDIFTGMEIVKKRAEFMSAICNGGMIAVLGQTQHAIVNFLVNENFEDIDIANLNSPSQFVLSGPAERIQECAKKMSQFGFKAIHLNVSGAFHSRYMKALESDFYQFLTQFSFKDPKYCVISNAMVEPYNADNMILFLSKQVSHPVRWCESIIKVIETGETTFHEVNSHILSKMVDEIKKTQPEQSTVKQHFIPTVPSLGSSHFKEVFGLRHAYVAGSMYRGISSPELVIRMAKANLLSFYGVGGLDLDEIESGIKKIQRELTNDESFGVNLLCNYMYPEQEIQCVELFLKYRIRIIEASAFLMITPAIAYFVIKGLYYDHAKGQVSTKHHLFAKVSRLETAKIFMEPIPSHVIESLRMSGKISSEEAVLAKTIPISHYICVEGDSGGHTDRKLLAPLLISILNLRNEMKKIYQNRYSFFVGAAGGLGEPISISTNFLMGADFILTGSINQCSVEARMSDRAKDLLQNMHTGDTEYSIAGDMFEMGAKVQVLKKGILFPTRANTLYNIYTLFKDVADLPLAMRDMIEKHFFRLSLQEVAEDLGDYYQQKKTSKEKMAALFRWYLQKSKEWALEGTSDRVADFQIHTGPALGMFNQWIKGTEYENWRNRHVDEIGDLLMESSLKCIKNFPILSR